MLETNTYKKLIEHYKNWIFGLPNSEYLRPMLEVRFSPEEAQCFVKFHLSDIQLRKFQES